MRPNFFHIGLGELAALGTMFSGLTLAVLLAFAKRPGRKAGALLSLALATVVLNTGGITSLLLPLLGPLLYFYVKAQTGPDMPLRRNDLLHLGTLAAGSRIAWWVPQIVVIAYLLLAYRLIRKFYQSQQPVSMDRPLFAFRRLEKTLCLTGISCVLWLCNALFGIAVALILIGTAAAALLKPDNSARLLISPPDRSEAREKGRRLKETVAVNRLYEDPELTLASLAAKLSMHPHDLSRIIHDGLNKNFSDFINEFRVREITRKMRDPAYDQFTLLSIAYASGFNSKTTFNRTFKEVTGLTPAEYKKKVPINKLEPLALRHTVTLQAEKSNRPVMFRNYFKTSFRNLLRHKVYSLINISGLAIGVACAILIMVYVNDELSYDRFHANVGQIYRIDKQTTKADGSTSNGSYTGYFQGPRFAANIPEIRGFVRYQPAQAAVRIGNDVQSQEVFLADANFLSVFTFPLLSGSAGTALSQPNSAVITEEMAKRYFGSGDALGKILTIRQDSIFKPFVITGVAKDCPQNSSIKFQVLLPLKVSAIDESNNGNWFNSFLSTFVVLAPGADLKAVQHKMDRVFEADASQAISEIRSKYKIKNIGIAYLLEPLTDIHLGLLVPPDNEALRDKSNPEFSYILSAIAVFVLLIACINFVNLTLARSVKRAREIGIRKVIGGTGAQLRLQFLAESFLLCLVAFVLALILVIVVLPVFSGLSNKALSLTYLLHVKLILGYVALFVVTGFLSGFYPSIVLSGYQPVQTLYGRFNLAGKSYLQKTLVVFQFALASFLIIGAITIYLQFSYLTTQDPGYDDTNLVTVNKYPLSSSEAALFKQQLMKNPDIVGVAPQNSGDNNNTVKTSLGEQINVAVETVDAAYLPLLKVPVLEGRNFTNTSGAGRSVLVNEAFVRQAGWKQPVGETIKGFGMGEDYTVAGVVRDYHYKPLTEKIGPQLFLMSPGDSYGMLYIRIRPGTETASLRYIASTFRELFPMSPFIYAFRQDQNRQAYAAEARWKSMILWSAVLTIFISCLGLFGLSVLAAEKRVKEIGIRKVLGASAGRIVAILSADFLKLVLISLILSQPLAWLAAGSWLQHYPYRIMLSGWVFAAGDFLVILIAFMTISFQSVKAAISNPVKSLRAE